MRLLYWSAFTCSLLTNAACGFAFWYWVNSGAYLSAALTFLALAYNAYIIGKHWPR